MHPVSRAAVGFCFVLVASSCSSTQTIQLDAGGNIGVAPEHQTTLTTMQTSTTEPTQIPQLEAAPTEPGTRPRDEPVTEPEPNGVEPEVAHPVEVELNEEESVVEEWKSDPLAPMILDEADIGDGWRFESVEFVDLTASDPDDTCAGVAPDPTHGLEIQFSRDNDSGFMLQVLLSGEVDQIETWLTAYRALADCSPYEDDGAILDLEIVPMADEFGADDTLAAIVTRTDAEHPSDTLVLQVLMARYEETMVVMMSGQLAPEEVSTLLSFEQMAELIVRSAGQGGLV